MSRVNILLLSAAAGPENTKFRMLSASFVTLFHRKCGAGEQTSADSVLEVQVDQDEMNSILTISFRSKVIRWGGGAFLPLG